MQVFVENPNTIVIDVDQGRQGRGISNITYTEVSGQYYLIVTYTDGTTETLGPLVVTGGAAFLLGGTAGAIPYQSAPNTTTFLPIGTANQVVVAGASAPQYTSNLTGLTVNNTPVGNTTPSTGAFTNLSASGTFALTGDQVQISEGGTGQTTANAAFNALAPSQTGNAGKYLKTDGTNSAWDQLDISTADITGTLPIVNGGTGATTAPGARANLSAAVLGTNNDITSMTGVTGGISSPDFVQFDTTATEANAVGKVYWDAAQGTLDVGLLGGNVVTRIGQTLVAFVTNAEAVTITKGQVVYLFGAQGDRATVKLAYNTSDATSAKTFGVVAENIGPNQTGFVMCQGVLEGLNLGAFTAGDTLYLGATPGSLTATKPAAPNHLVYVGLVERANPGNGQLYVKVQNGYELDEIHDVQIINPQNGQTIIYDATTSLWKNANLTAGSGISVTNGAASITVSNTGVLSFSGGTTGLTPATSTTGVVTLGGTLNVANGGTGATTASGARTNLGLGTISTQDANNVTITGGTVNNTSVGASTPSTGAFTSVAMTSGTVSTTPASATDIANKQYVDTLVSSGITYHAPVKYEVPSTTGNLNATYNNGTAGVGATLTNAGTLAAFTPDGVVAQAGDRILIYNQTNAAQNGVYVVTTVGSGSVAWVLTRASDADTYALKSPNSLGEGDAFFIQSGNTGAGETYVCNTQGTITFGTTPITFVQVSASQVYSAGTGLTLSGTQFSITNTAVTPNSYGSASAVGTFTVNQQGQLTLAATTPIAIANTQVSGLGTMSTQNANSVAITGGSIDGTIIGGTTRAAGSFTTLTLTNALGIANGGTGQTTANAAFNALAPSQTGNAGKYLTTDGTNTSWATNPLGTVTSVDVSGGTTGLTTSGGPITSSGTITLGGTLATTNGGTGLTSFTANRVFYASSTSAIGQSANLTFDGTTLTANALTTTSTVTINGGTANCVAFLDGSKVLSAGVNLTFNGSTLGVGSSLDLGLASTTPIINFTSNGSFRASLGYNNSNGVVTLNNAYGPFAVSVGSGGSSSEGMRLTSTGLGVGTSAPTEKLNVNGGIVAKGDAALASGAGAYLYYSSGTSSAELTALNPAVAWLNQRYNALAHIWSLSGSEGMRLTSTGLGIGTSSPIAKLDVRGNLNLGDGTSNSNITNTVDTAFMLISGGTSTQNNIRLYGPSHPTLANVQTFITNGSERMRLDASGNLGLGVTPSAWSTSGKALEFAAGSIYSYNSGASGEFDYVYNAYFDGSWKYKASSSAASLYSIQPGIYKWFTAPSGTAGNAITFTQAMTLDASGNLGLGVTPSAWNASNAKVMQFGSGGTFVFGDANSNNTGLNAYYETSWKYTGNGFASRYEQQAGQHRWYNAPNNTSGAGAGPISFTQAMTLDASGNLSIGVTTSSARLHLAKTGGVALRLDDLSTNYWEISNDSNLIFNRGGTERARITSGGDLLVGTTSALSSVSGSSQVKIGEAGIQTTSQAISANTATTIARSGSGGVAIVAGYNGTGQYSAIVLFKYGGTATSVVGVLNDTGSTITYSISGVNLQITSSLALTNVTVTCIRSA